MQTMDALGTGFSFFISSSDGLVVHRFRRELRKLDSAHIRIGHVGEDRPGITGVRIASFEAALF